MQLFMHTQKAVRAGHPADRLFVVVSSSSGSGRSKQQHCAWKVKITRDGLIHPAYASYKKATPENLASMAKLQKGRNGSEPTALFKEDSLYREVTTEDVQAEVSRLKTMPTPAKYKIFVEARDKGGSHGGSNQDYIVGAFDIRVRGQINSDVKASILEAVSRFREDLIRITC